MSIKRVFDPLLRAREGGELLPAVVALVEGKPSPRSNAIPSLYRLSRKLEVLLCLPALTKLVKNPKLPFSVTVLSREELLWSSGAAGYCSSLQMLCLILAL